MYKIEKNIDIPLANQSRAQRYPFGDMEVGDSFIIAAADVGESNRVHSAASYFGSRNKKRFCVRRLPDGVRVWRVA